MSYHDKEIERGVIGEFSKVKEEFQELEDAFEQGDKVLQICELTDLIGAIELFASNKFNMELEDLVKFSKKTQNAFENGHR